MLAGCTAEPLDDPDPDDREGAGGGRAGPCPEQADGPAAGGSPAPARLRVPGRRTLDLARAPGVPTVVNLWGSWCGPCREELPVLQGFADVAGDRVRVVGVISKDGVPQAESFAADAGVTFPQRLRRGGGAHGRARAKRAAVHAFLAADGTLVHSELGPVDSVDELRGLVAEHLGVQL